MLSKFYRLSEKPNETMQNVRKNLLFIILMIANVIGLPVILIGFLEAMELNQFATAVSYLVFYSPVALVTIFHKKAPYKLKALIILISFYLIGIINLMYYGISGAAIPIFLTMVVLATVLFDVKFGLWSLFASLLPMLITGYLFIHEKISLDVKLTQITTNTISWLTAGSVLILLGILCAISFGITQNKMIQIAKFSQKQAEDLKALNLKLQEDILKRKQTEDELNKYQKHLEELVKERTFKIEENNNELIEKNKELELYNQLFIGREFRIKELRDQLKELEKK